jgi:chemotaxis protein MotD
MDGMLVTGGSVPNAASLLPASPARPPLTKAEYQTATPDGSAFAGLLDIGTETPPPPQDRPSPRADRADDTRDAKRPDPGRRDDEPAPPPENNTANEPQDQAKAAPARQENQTGTAIASKDDASVGTPKADEKTATDANASAATDGQANADATVIVAAATAETLAVVVTPVTISLLADQTAADTTSTSDTGAVEAATSKTASTHPATDATFALSVTPEKAIPATPAQPTKIDDAVADAHAAIVVAAQPAQPAHLKQTGPHKPEKSGEADDADTTVAEANDNNGQLTEAEHAEFLKSLHAANEGKARRPEHMADANSETKAAHDPAPAPAALVNAPLQQQTAAPAGLVQTTTAVSGVHAADPRSASGPAADAAVPVAGLAVEIVTRAREGKNRFEIRLDPPELGRIDVRLDIDGQGNVTSRLLVERADTLDLLRRDFSNLERALNDAGLKTDNGSLQFAMRDQGFAGDSQQQNEFSRSARIIVPGETDTVAPAARYNMAQRSGIDIRV